MAPSGSTEVTTAFCMTSQMCMPITMTLFAPGRKPLGTSRQRFGGNGTSASLSASTTPKNSNPWSAAAERSCSLRSADNVDLAFHLANRPSPTISDVTVAGVAPGGVCAPTRAVRLV